MMLSCKEVTQLVSQGLDRRLGLGERLAVRVHFAICSGCYNFRRQVELLRRAVQRLGQEPDGP
jgi:hypothetical protein